MHNGFELFFFIFGWIQCLSPSVFRHFYAIRHNKPNPYQMTRNLHNFQKRPLTQQNRTQTSRIEAEEKTSFLEKEKRKKSVASEMIAKLDIKFRQWSFKIMMRIFYANGILETRIWQRIHNQHEPNAPIYCCSQIKIETIRLYHYVNHATY